MKLFFGILSATYGQNRNEHFHRNWNTNVTTRNLRGHAYAKTVTNAHTRMDIDIGDHSAQRRWQDRVTCQYHIDTISRTSLWSGKWTLRSNYV